eukprot:TRINITY_DN2445_c0_g1_i1.p1 TRINITY_DN2445_c0_g1~~TRINITY_DN2445_c0_g1_i1.p1  ORF type:complete len:233 (-),score=17.84 TRINITY_DN2445_c0_g1_i1:529-1179(-)
MEDYRSGMEALLMEFIFRNHPIPLLSDSSPAVQQTPRTTGPLRFKVVTTDGGYFSPEYQCSNLIRADSTVYSTTKKENTNVVLKFDDVGPFVLTHIIVKAPDARFTAPIGTGLIFVSMENDFDTSYFDGFTRAQYESHLRTKAASGTPVTKSDPAAFFEVNSQTCVTKVKLRIPRTGRYVLIKLLRSRNDGENIDIQFVGLEGFVGAHSFSYGELC